MPSYEGRVVRVLAPHRIEVDLLVDKVLGVLLRRPIVIEGIPEEDAEQRPREVQHCVVVLCGGKDVRVDLIHHDILQPMRAHVYVPEYHPEEHPGPVEVGPWVAWASTVGYDVKALRQALRGKD